LTRHYSDSDAYAELAGLLDQREYDRELLYRVLTEQNRSFSAGAATFANIDRLRKPETLVVIGGQQTGLFGGPLYTLHKAITVVKLAEALTSRLQRDVVPVFWMASDDHDFVEVNHIHVPDLSGQIQKIVDEGQEEGERTPVSSRHISGDISLFLKQLLSYLPETEFSAGMVSELETAYRPGRGYPEAFAIWLQKVLDRYGLIVVEPADPRLKQPLIPLFRREIIEESPVSEAVLAQTGRLVKDGYDAQLQLQDGILNIFCHTPQRESISFRNGKYMLKNSGKEFSQTEILTLLENQPENFSPNAAFRPLIQDFMLPTLAMVLGPSEIAYFVQLKTAYERMGIDMPIVFPRASITLMEPRAARILRKYDITMQDIFQNKDRIIDSLVAREIPKSLFSTIENGEKTVSGIWNDLVERASSFDANLQKPAEIAKGRSISQFEFLNKKIMQAARQKDEVLRSQVQKMLNLLYPMSSPQERIFNLLPFYVRFGKQFIDTIYTRTDIFDPDHQVITFD
jgi:bacillithiol biosynthesis cysteine-adding enzyme BshC